MPQRLIEAAQAIEIGDHQGVGLRIAQQGPRLDDEAATVQKPGQHILFAGGELGFGHDHTRGARAAFLQPFASPDAGLAAAHADAGADLAAGRSHRQEALHEITVLRQAEGVGGGAGAIGGQGG